MAIENVNPLQRDYYKIEITRPKTGNQLYKIAFFAQEAPLPGLALDTIEQPTTLSVGIPIPANKVIFEPFNVRFIVDANADNWWEIYNWIADMTHMGSDCSDDPSGGDALDYQDWHGEIKLTVLNKHYQPNYIVKFENVIPIKLSPLAFNSILEVAEPVIASVTFTYSYYHKVV